ncbi:MULTISPECIES: DUF308 domain-containing protein [unclassified Butyrivibrio]|uniref:DUF308 domain-containing protein n=1 Tax=unclassified Butyrivibrio TaxID=2639466 RepID=UPI00047A2977|nr:MULTISPECIES: DUF308 domain-containing protein [unclassified Butyrivibrio]
MSRIHRINNIIFGIVMLIYAYLMIQTPDEAYPVILAIIALGLMLSGLKELFYFLTMARFMVGGKLSLYKGIITLDFGLLTATLTDIPSFYILMYLAGIHAFAGLVEFLRANEARINGARSWKTKSLHGLVDIGIAVLCFINYKNQETAVVIYSLGLIYSGVLRIISALRKTTIIYIP